MSKTMRAVAAFQNGFAFYLIQKQADLVGSHLLMVEPAHELRDGSLEVDVVLPQRVVGIDEQSLGTGNEGRHRVCILTAKPYRRSAGDRRHRRHRASSPSSVVVPPISAMAAMMCDYGDLDAAICRSPITSSVLVPPMSAMTAIPQSGMIRCSDLPILSCYFRVKSAQIRGKVFLLLAATISRMKMGRLLLVFLLAGCIYRNVYPQAGRRAEAKPKTTAECVIREPIHGDLAGQVAKFKLVAMPFSVVGLSPQEQKLAYKLVEAAQSLESIYWRQSDPRGLELLKRLTGCNTVMAQKV